MKVVYVSDIHAPYHDPAAIKLAQTITAAVKPDIMFFGGDIVDCYAVSDFDRDPQRVVRFQDELDSAMQVMAGFRRHAKSAFFLPGNHERRWQRFINRHPEISSLRDAEMGELLKLKAQKIQLLEHGRDFKIGELFYMHGDEVSGGGVFPARGVYLKEQGNVVFGHYHRAQVFYNRLKDGTTHGSFANPCLCSLKQEYIKGTTQWQQGLSVITYYGAKFRVDQIVFFSDKKKLYGAYEGKLFETKL
jgi:predicted phosphodiesterase